MKQIGHLVTSTCLFFLLGCSHEPPTVSKQVARSVPIREVEARAPTPKPAHIQAEGPIVDSALTLPDALAGNDFPSDVKTQQRLINVRYYSFDRKLHQGQIVVNENLVSDVKAIFREIEASRFPVARVVPIVKYEWSDDQSVADDNTSGFNYRTVPATHHLSSHALGRAIDLNPRENPYFNPVRPKGEKYDPSLLGALSKESPPTVAFRRHGWEWGGVWKRGRDYQHFEKVR